jgi:phage baseplate assembly protein W
MATMEKVASSLNHHESRCTWSEIGTQEQIDYGLESSLKSCIYFDRHRLLITHFSRSGNFAY